MRSLTLHTSRMRWLLVAVVTAVVLTIGLGYGVAAAQDLDQHSGGSSPSNGPVDEGNPPATVAGETVSRDSGGLPVTGAEILGIVVVGGAIAIIGVGAVAASRRVDHRRAA